MTGASSRTSAQNGTYGRSRFASMLGSSHMWHAANQRLGMMSRIMPGLEGLRRI
jgi:hypothetical protein